MLQPPLSKPRSLRGFSLRGAGPDSDACPQSICPGTPVRASSVRPGRHVGARPRAISRNGSVRHGFAVPGRGVHDRLAAIRYPDEHASYASADWDRWVQEVRAEAVRLVGNDARWRASRVMVEDDVYEGVQAAVDPRFTAPAFHLP